MLRTDDMYVFRAVVETNSFTKAASALDLSRSLISKRITDLEKGLGVRLMNRTTRRLSLTEAGEAFYKYCVSVINTVAEAEEAVRNIASKPAGTLRIAMPIGFGEDIFTPVIADLLKAYPHLGLRMDFTDNVVDMIQLGYDVCIYWAGPLRSSGLIARMLKPFNVAVCATPTYFKRKGIPKTPKDLKHHNCLIYSGLRRGPEMWPFQDPAGHRLEVPVSGTIEANDTRPLIEAARQSLGLLYVPTFMICEELRTGTLVRVLTAYTALDVGIYALYPHRNIPSKTRVLLDFLTQKLAPLPWT